MKALRYRSALAIGKAATFMIRALRLGSGSVLAGHLSKKLCPDVYARLCCQAKEVIYITGTNGKTTTTHLLSAMLGKKRTVYNSTGANLEAGLISALVNKTRNGKLRDEFIVLEVDEKALIVALKQHPPTLLICLNLFRDQLDRHAEPDLTCKNWLEAMHKLPAQTTLLLNGDDPGLVKLGESLKQNIVYFGLDEPGKEVFHCSHAIDSHYCPNCKTPLDYQTIHLSHLGDFSCRTCTFKRQDPLHSSRKWPSISPYVHNKYNTMSAVAAAEICGIAPSEIHRTITRFSPVFGREEEVILGKRKLLFLLAKNVVSLNESLAVAMHEQNLGGILLALNDHDADGKDISWIWDADLEKIKSLTENVTVTGTRAYELAICLEHNAVSALRVNPNLKSQALLALKQTHPGKTLCVIATYTAMLQLRKLFLGREIL